MAKGKDRIPEFDSRGNLPPGVYKITLEELNEQFTWNSKRKTLFEGLKHAIQNLAEAGIKRIWIDGSFITSKEEPSDIDGCWEPTINIKLDVLDPVFLKTKPPRREMKEKYKVDFFPFGVWVSDPPGNTIQEFFQIDKNGNAKGIVVIEI